MIVTTIAIVLCGNGLSGEVRPRLELIEQIQKLGGSVNQNKSKEPIEIHLTLLDLRHSNIAFSGRIESLKLLNLNFTRFEPGLIANVQAPSLEEFLLVNSNAGDDHLVRLSRFSKLRRLNLRGTPVTDNGASELKKLDKLVFLDLTDTRVTEGIYLVLGGLSNLEDLSLFGTKVNNKGANSLNKLERLQSLNLGCTQVTDEGVVALTPLVKRVNWLSLQGTKVSNGCLKSIENNQKLRELHLEDTQIDDAGLEQVSQLLNLEELYMSGTTVTDKGLAHLSRLTKLRTLYLNRTQITDKGLRNLGKIPSLRLLSVETCRVSAEAIRAIEEGSPKLLVLQ